MADVPCYGRIWRAHGHARSDHSPVPAPGEPTTPAINVAIAGGYIKGGQVTVPAGINLTLRRSLTIVSFGTLRIDGDLIAAAPLPIDIALVSLQGDVVVGVGVRVGFSTSGGVKTNGRIAAEPEYWLRDLGSVSWWRLG